MNSRRIRYPLQLQSWNRHRLLPSDTGFVAFLEQVLIRYVTDGLLEARLSGQGILTADAAPISRFLPRPTSWFHKGIQTNLLNPVGHQN